MSGGSSSKKKSSSSAKVDENAVPAYLGGGQQSTFPQAMPGQLNALAEQLSMGYGAPVAQNLAFLEALYSPMNVPAKPVAAPKPGTSSKPAVSNPKPSVSAVPYKRDRSDRQR